MVLGFYYMIKFCKFIEEYKVKGEGLIFYLLEEVFIVYNEKKVEFNVEVKVRIKDFNEEGELVIKIIIIIIGRIIFNDIVLEEVGFINEVLIKKLLCDIIGNILLVIFVFKIVEFFD